MSDSPLLTYPTIHRLAYGSMIWVTPELRREARAALGQLDQLMDSGEHKESLADSRLQVIQHQQGRIQDLEREISRLATSLLSLKSVSISAARSIIDALQETMKTHEQTDGDHPGPAGDGKDDSGDPVLQQAQE